MEWSEQVRGGEKGPGGLERWGDGVTAFWRRHSVAHGVAVLAKGAAGVELSAAHPALEPVVARVPGRRLAGRVAHIPAVLVQRVLRSECAVARPALPFIDLGMNGVTARQTSCDGNVWLVRTVQLGSEPSPGAI
jgi:hypothetical protein